MSTDFRPGQRVTTPFGTGTITGEHDVLPLVWVALDAQRDVPVEPHKIEVITDDAAC